MKELGAGLGWMDWGIYLTSLVVYKFVYRVGRLWGKLRLEK